MKVNLDQEDIIAFVREQLSPQDVVDNTTELFSSGLLDSVGMINLINFIEERAGIEIPMQDVTLENFDSPERILLFVQRYA